MSWQGWLTLGVIAGSVGLLSLTRRTPWVVLTAALAVLMTAGVVDERAAVEGLSNAGTVTLAALFAMTAGLRETGAIAWMTAPLLGRPRGLRQALARIIGLVAPLSAFMNNAPLVAVMLPVLHDRARKWGISPSKLLLPLSYASILGGLCTLVGTSTIVVVNGLLISELGHASLGMFEIAWVGVPAAVAGGVFLLATAHWLPDRRPVVSLGDDPRQYTVEMVVRPGGGLGGQTIEQAGLRHLPDLYLIEIERDGQVLPAVSSGVALRDDDRLVFVGVVGSVRDLQRIRGLAPATSQVYKLDEPRANRHLVEAVVSHTCPIVGRTIREGRFRTRYHAAVIAVGRSGERLPGKIGDVVLRPGDMLLLEARASFADQHRDSRDFYLVSRMEDSAPPRHERAGLALAILGAMVLSVSLGWLSMLNAALLAASVMIATRCCSSESALRAVDWQVLLVIAASFGLGRAMEASALAHNLATSLVTLTDAPLPALALLSGLTMVLTNVINAKAAAVLMFPIAVNAATTLGSDPLPFIVGVMIGAAASFATPIAYQTNLMVMGPGGYRFSDYLKLGIPLSLIVWALAMVIIPWRWPF